MINHINKKNNPQIVNISQKQITERVAKAEATISFDKITFNKIKLIDIFTHLEDLLN